MNSIKLPKVFIIVLSYNASETLRDCLHSVFKLDYPNFELVLVDNASTDGSFEMARENFSRTHIIRSEKNIGFGPGCNLGIRFSLERMADYIFLINQDTLLEKNTLSILVEEAEKNPKVGILSPLIFHGESDRIWFSGGRIQWSRMKTVHLQNEPETNLPYASEYLSGCAMLIRKEVFQTAGIFDEDYFLYYEDADLSWRARRSGFQLLVVPQAKIHHLEKSEQNKAAKTYWLVYSSLIFFQKNSLFWIRPWIAFYLLMRKMKNSHDLQKKNNPLAETVKRAYNDYKQWKIMRPPSPL